MCDFYGKKLMEIRLPGTKVCHYVQFESFHHVPDAVVCKFLAHLSSFKSIKLSSSALLTFASLLSHGFSSLI